ncbi:MAG: DNA repair protein RecN (Recombination protein N), partial [Candidatus Azotimanducaceae bacterium]
GQQFRVVFDLSLAHLSQVPCTFMLTHLTVQNFALVDKLELEFAAGMTVVTGETGAGKSIILDALGLTLGDRADTGLIGNAARRAEIHATFDITDNPAASEWLAGRELPGDDAGECILRRSLGADGRSRGFINGAPSNVADLKILGEMLLDIHSQHEHQSLLKKDTHRRLLDEYGNVLPAALQVQVLSIDFQQARRRLDTLRASNAEQTARLQLLAYQTEELELLAIEPGEHLGLEEEQKRLSHVDDILHNCSAALEICSLNDDANVLTQLGHALQLLRSVQLETLAPVTELFGSSMIQLEEAVADLQRFVDSVEPNPQRLTDVEARLSSIYEVARKHHIKPTEISELLTRIQAEMASLENIDVEIDSLDTAARELQASYRLNAEKLSKAREKAARQLEKQVSEQLANLGMRGAVFKVSLTSLAADAIAPGGLEDVEFLISTNPGQSPKALNKVASGGELSRISLAIQVVTADTSKVPSLVFDEVDVGIGGAIAEVVGSLLRRLGNSAQIICVTHLPQVASQGHQHYQVTKSNDSKQARTRITTLPDEEKIKEIARMLGGVALTTESLEHARAMYQAAQVVTKNVSESEPKKTGAKNKQ